MQHLREHMHSAKIFEHPDCHNFRNHTRSLEQPVFPPWLLLNWSICKDDTQLRYNQSHSPALDTYKMIFLLQIKKIENENRKTPRISYSEL